MERNVLCLRKWDLTCNREGSIIQLPMRRATTQWGSGELFSPHASPFTTGRLPLQHHPGNLVASFLAFWGRTRILLVPFVAQTLFEIDFSLQKAQLVQAYLVRIRYTIDAYLTRDTCSAHASWPHASCQACSIRVLSSQGILALI